MKGSKRGTQDVLGNGNRNGERQRCEPRFFIRKLHECNQKCSFVQLTIFTATRLAEARIACSEFLDPHEVAVVQMTDPIVRRCFLIGDDPVSGKNFDQRIIWIENDLTDVDAKAPVSSKLFDRFRRFLPAPSKAASPFCCLSPVLLPVTVSSTFRRPYLGHPLREFCSNEGT